MTESFLRHVETHHLSCASQALTDGKVAEVVAKQQVATNQRDVKTAN